MTETIERLTLIEPDWTDVERRSRVLRKRHVLHKTALAAGALAAAAILAGGAYAAAHTIWSGHDLTPADIARQETVVTNDKWAICSGHNQCTTHTGTHKEVTMLPSMGEVFILPDGLHEVDLFASAAIVDMPRDLGIWKPVEDKSGKWIGGTWRFPIPDGERTIAWSGQTGAVWVKDKSARETTTTRLHSGDVLPLIPGTLTDHPRSLDKAVTVDLPTGNRVIIFAQLNETYIDDPEPQPGAEPLAPGEAARYGLTPIGRYSGKLPVTSTGGIWRVRLNGLTSTISWHAGDSFVTVADTTASGTTTTQVPIGHELPLVPFK